MIIQYSRSFSLNIHPL